MSCILQNEKIVSWVNLKDQYELTNYMFFVQIGPVKAVNFLQDGKNNK